jgi:hypothetical protein
MTRVRDCLALRHLDWAHICSPTTIGAGSTIKHRRAGSSRPVHDGDEDAFGSFCGHRDPQLQTPPASRCPQKRLAASLGRSGFVFGGSEQSPFRIRTSIGDGRRRWRGLSCGRARGGLTRANGGAAVHRKSAERVLAAVVHRSTRSSTNTGSRRAKPNDSFAIFPFSPSGHLRLLMNRTCTTARDTA